MQIIPAAMRVGSLANACSRTRRAIAIIAVTTEVPLGGARGALPKALQEGGAGSENSAEAGSVKASPGFQGPHLGRFSVPRFGPAGAPFERQLG